MEGDIIFEDKWLRIVEEKPKPKTKVFSVWSKSSNCQLGEISWYPSWRHYCFIMMDFVFSDRCLLSIGKFTLRLNLKDKSRRVGVNKK